MMLSLPRSEFFATRLADGMAGSRPDWRTLSQNVAASAVKHFDMTCRRIQDIQIPQHIKNNNAVDCVLANTSYETLTLAK
jgi:hypothetical protein